MGLRGFGSDNFSGVLPEVFKEMILTCISFIMEREPIY